MALEGVVADDRLEVMEHQRDLYQMLSSARMVVVSTNPDREAVRMFLRTQHLRYDMLLNREQSVALDKASWKVTQVRNVKAMGWPVAYYLDSEPDVVRRVFAEGTAAMLLAHRLVRPDWLPDSRAPQSWNDLTAFIDEQEEKRSDPPVHRPKPWEQSVVP